MGGDTAAPSGLYTRLCHAFSSRSISCKKMVKVGSLVFGVKCGRK